jgi:hypothetical protein
MSETRSAAREDEMAAGAVESEGRGAEKEDVYFASYTSFLQVFWRNYFAHVYAVRQAILYSRLEKEQIARASSPEAVGKRNMDDLTTLLNDSKTDDVVELSSLSIDGLSLEEQINAALNDEI